ncbi:MAG: cell division protein FtsL [Nitrospina sp.]|nr:cell division protein FtsL [Nitrospina sp.]
MPDLLRRIHHWMRLTPREFRVVALVTVVFSLSALTYVWPNVRMVLLAYEFQKQQRIHQALLSENELLLLERESLTSLDRIAPLATGELGMHPAEPGQVITVFLNQKP